MLSSLLRDLHFWRPRLVQDLAGDVLEIGAGTGENFPYYRQARALWAIEPHPQRAQAAQETARRVGAETGLPIQVDVAPAEALPYADASFDTVVSSLVFCSVSDQRQALQEIERVLRPQGLLVMVEHVRPRTPLLAHLASAVTPWWRHLAWNCHLDRPTLAVLAEMGWQVNIHRRRGVFVKLTARTDPHQRTVRPSIPINHPTLHTK